MSKRTPSLQETQTLSVAQQLLHRGLKIYFPNVNIFLSGLHSQEALSRVALAWKEDARLGLRGCETFAKGILSCRGILSATCASAAQPALAVPLRLLQQQGVKVYS
jgi:hypothetical protein